MSDELKAEKPMKFVIRRIRDGDSGEYYADEETWEADAVNAAKYETLEHAQRNIRRLMQSDRVHVRESVEYDVIGICESPGPYYSEVVRKAAKGASQ